MVLVYQEYKGCYVTHDNVSAVNLQLLGLWSEWWLAEAIRPGRRAFRLLFGGCRRITTGGIVGGTLILIVLINPQFFVKLFTLFLLHFMALVQ